MSAASRPLVAFATARDWPDLVADDRLAARILAERGVDVVPAIWDEPAEDWSRFDAVVVRSCWDYHVKSSAFVAWAGAFESSGAPPLFNAPAVLRWNLHKRYLLDLAAAGVPIVETVLVERGGSLDLAALMDERGWTRCVVKPAVSATSYRTERVERSGDARAEPDRAACARAAELAREHDVLVQPFRPEILVGELSFLFVDGVFQHCVRKTPVPGDFRSQEEFGGRITLETPGEALLDQARRAFAACGADLLYARIDGLPTDDGFLLMELEAIDPALYLAEHPPSATAFAAAIERRVRSAR